MCDLQHLQPLVVATAREQVSLCHDANGALLSPDVPDEGVCRRCLGVMVHGNGPQDDCLLVRDVLANEVLDHFDQELVLLVLGITEDTRHVVEGEVRQAWALNLDGHGVWAELGLGGTLGLGKTAGFVLWLLLLGSPEVPVLGDVLSEVSVVVEDGYLGPPDYLVDGIGLVVDHLELFSVSCLLKPRRERVVLCDIGLSDGLVVGRAIRIVLLEGDAASPCGVTG